MENIIFVYDHCVVRFVFTSGQASASIRITRIDRLFCTGNVPLGFGSGLRDFKFNHFSTAHVLDVTCECFEDPWRMRFSESMEKEEGRFFFFGSKFWPPVLEVFAIL